MKRDNSYPSHLFFSLPTHAHLASPYHMDKPRGFFSWDPGPGGSRTLDVPGSQFFRALLHQSLMSQWGWGGKVVKVGYTRACVCPGVGSIEVRPLVWSFLTMAPLTGLKKWWYAVGKGTLQAGKGSSLEGVDSNSDQNPASLVPSSPQRGWSWANHLSQQAFVE